ncbi:MAG: glucose-6-phosphate isomerase [Candidatus Margulisbacteria bacterium]|nr:glucose-6-phosphate isomerase [Candidatus Margulisiibacteriota bacterium]MBU1616811.1 glucose-6-phosphate isomerase [Candidatus Margulisiibacteriota bacterium]
MFNQAKAYKKLAKHYKEIGQKHLRELFDADPRRGHKFSVRTEHLYYDFSRQRVTEETVQLLASLATEQNLSGKIQAMFSGEKINRTENRGVLHVALRNRKDVMPEVAAVLKKIEQFSGEILSGARTGVTGKKLRNIVSIGIGGSYLGPEYLAVALRPYAQPGMNLLFIANIDGTDFEEKISGLDPEETMVIVVSKTFTTAETMHNARTAKKWVLAGLKDHPESIKKHFVAVSTAKDKVETFGIDPANMFGFWDWVGGRFSATSAVGLLPLSLYLGFENVQYILEGAFWLDTHFLNAPIEKNIPILSALLDIWNINFLGFKTRALLPYSQGLAKLAAHTQQVEMESNGKSVDLDGNKLKFATGEIVFGEPGTNGQHSFYQLLHQGTQIVPCDFIGFITPQYQYDKDPTTRVTHHEELMTNFFAQPDALAFGKDDSNPAKVFPGNRPSSSLLLEALTPFTAGLLLAWTEHRTAVKGFIWGINSFDQEGVQLGKVLGLEHRERIIEYYDKTEYDSCGLVDSTDLLLKSFLDGNLLK